MPTYDYKCLDCGITFEQFQRITEEPLTVCPKCNGHIKRLISAGTGPIFRGSGFYHTDYKNPPKKSESKVTDKKSDSSNSEKK